MISEVSFDRLKTTQLGASILKVYAIMLMFYEVTVMMTLPFSCSFGSTSFKEY